MIPMQETGEFDPSKIDDMLAKNGAGMDAIGLDPEIQAQATEITRTKRVDQDEGTQVVNGIKFSGRGRSKQLLARTALPDLPTSD
jgi:hypothetical protein